MRELKEFVCPLCGHSHKALVEYHINTLECPSCGKKSTTQDMPSAVSGSVNNNPPSWLDF